MVISKPAYTNQIVVGGVYSMSRADKSYQVWLVVALDPENVYVVFYQDFDKLPTLEDIKKVQPNPEFSFMRRESWAEGHIRLIGLKGVTDSDLTGYYNYLEQNKAKDSDG